MKQMDTEMNRIGEYLNEQLTSEAELMALASPDLESQYFAAQHFSKVLQENIYLFDYVEGILVYAAPSQLLSIYWHGG